MEYRVLGPIEAVAGDTMVPVTAGKQRELLALLLISANRPVSTDVLIDGLWGERPPATVAKNLQVLVSQLRKTLGEGAIATVAGGYQLTVVDGATDVEQYEILLERGRRELADDRPRVAQRALEDALALWRGRAYEDVVYEDFARAEVERLEQRRLAGVEERFEAVLANGGHADAVSDLERFASEHPLRERPTTLLMLGLYRSGRQAEALSAYERLRHSLSEELGIEPGPAVSELHGQILRHDPALGATDRPPALRRVAHRRTPLLLAAGAILLLVTAVAAAIVASQGGAARITQVAPDSLGVIEPSSGRVVAQFAAGSTPTSVATDGTVAWVLNADDATVSRIDLTGGGTISRNPGHTPVELGYGAGALWVSYADRGDEGITTGLLQLDPDTLRVVRTISLPGTLPADAGTYVPLAVGFGAVYAIGSQGLVRVDAASGRITAHAAGSDTIAVGDGAVWVTAWPGKVIGLDPMTLRQTSHVHVSTSQSIVRLAAGGGAVWAADDSGLVWRITPGSPGSAESIRVGLSALDVAYGDGAAWVASAVDGTVARIDPATDRVRTISLGAAPQRVAVGGGRVLASVAGGASPAISPGSTAGLAALPQSSCGPMVYGGPGTPDLLIASDMPLSAPEAPTTQAMVQAIEYILRQADFRAGRFTVAYQSCDDSTVQAGTWDGGKCAGNARSYVQTASVIGVIGTFNSGCAAEELPILNRGAVAMVSPANSYSGLTKSGVGVLPGDPTRYYPTGTRTYLRAYPADDIQARADVELAKQLGAHRVYAFMDSASSPYAVALAHTFAAAAPSSGLEIVGPSAPPVRQAALHRFVVRLAAKRVDAVFMAGVNGDISGRLLIELRRQFGPNLPVIASDGLLAGLGPADTAPGDPTAGTYFSAAYVSDPARQLPPAGRQFVRDFSATQPRHTINTFTPYAAQATQVLLAAIAHSDGTRKSVVANLQGIHVTNGILGSFGFDRNGDMTANLMPIFRIPLSGRPPTLDINHPPPLYTEISVGG